MSRLQGGSSKLLIFSSPRTTILLLMSTFLTLNNSINKIGEVSRKDIYSNSFQTCHLKQNCITLRGKEFPRKLQAFPSKLLLAIILNQFFTTPVSKQLFFDEIYYGNSLRSHSTKTMYLLAKLLQ